MISTFRKLWSEFDPHNLRYLVNLGWKGSANLICPAPLMAIITGVGPVLSLFFNHLGIYNEEFTLFDTSRVWVFDGFFLLDTIRVYIPCTNFHT